MTEPLFIARGKRPDDSALGAALGKLKKHWDAVVARLENVGDGLKTEWKYYGEKHGWQFKATNARKRAVLYMIPRREGITVAFVLSDRAFEAVRASALPKALIGEIESSRRSVEGRPARIVVTTGKDVKVVGELLAIVLKAA